MSICPRCTAPITPDAKFCTECGNLVPAPDPSESADPCLDEAHTALAAANLLKLRGEWQEAIDKCMLVLSLDEDNAAAHSLLGDIYRDQGRFGEAMHWYRMALDLNPDSPADKTKLEQTVASSLTDNAPKRDRKAEWILTVKRVLAESALAIGLLLIITTIWPMIFHPGVGTETPTDRELGRPQRYRLPVVSENGEVPQTPAGAVPAAPMSMSKQEDALLQALNSSPALIRHNLEVRAILIDPRNRSAVITVVCPRILQGTETEVVVRSGLIVLREACFEEHGLDHFTVRAVYDGTSTRPAEVRFVADAERNTVLSISPETADYAQLVGVLRNPWWATGK